VPARLGQPVGVERGRVAGGHPQLLLDQVDAGDQLGHRMLDLQPGVHLQEEELARPVRRDQALDGAGAAVVDGLRGPPGGGEHPLPQGRRHPGRRGLLGHLLVPPLDRAVPLPSASTRPSVEPEHLHLDVPGVRQVALQEDRRRAEEPLRLVRAVSYAVRSAGSSSTAAIPIPPPPADRLHHHRVADPGGRGRRGVGVGQRVGARRDRHPGRRHRGPRGDLVAHRLDRLRGRARPRPARRR
jgi:hypothetical protein